MKTSTLRWFLLLNPTVILVFLTACNSGEVTSVPTPEPLIANTATIEPALPPTAIIAPTLMVDPDPTLDVRLPPDRWKEWPVVPAGTVRSMEIYRTGLTLGNNPNAFSKVGDCQNIKAAFMGFFDIPDRYNLGPDYLYLQETIDQFSGYFNTDGQAVKGGFNAATVLSPLWANPEVCLAGENPLECELRLTKPSIVFISFEVWWEGRTAEEYEKYMRQIIETVIAHGAVPILATKADNVEGDHSINFTTASLAYEYDIPLWNFWLAVQPLPNHGLDTERNDRFHISTEAWNTRSFTGLQALDNVWKSVKNPSQDIVSSPTQTAAPTSTPGPLPSQAPALKMDLSEIDLVFGLVAKKGGDFHPQGVYGFDFGSNSSRQLLDSNWEFQGSSTDGESLLVSHGSNLYLVQGNSTHFLAGDLFFQGEISAIFMPDGTLLYLKAEGDDVSLVQVQPDGSPVSSMTPLEGEPISLYPSPGSRQVFWENGVCANFKSCDRKGAWVSDLQAGTSNPLVDISRPLVSPDGTIMAFEYHPTANTSNLAFAEASGEKVREFPLFGDIVSGYSWQPTGEWLAVHMSVRSEYSGRIMEGVNFLVKPKTFLTKQLPSVLLMNPRLNWSPDNNHMAWLGTDVDGSHYVIRLYEVNVQSGAVIDLTDALGNQSDDFMFVTNSSWLENP
jgi:hypothetical protein